jgi:hypothetical protein
MAQIVVGHTQLSQTVTMEVDRDLLTRAKSGANPAAEDKLIILFKQRYTQVHRRNVGYLPRRGLQIQETTESQQRPQGCGCDCAGCDDQGYHCHRQDRDCYL